MKKELIRILGVVCLFSIAATGSAQAKPSNCKYYPMCSAVNVNCPSGWVDSSTASNSRPCYKNLVKKGPFSKEITRGSHSYTLTWYTKEADRFRVGCKQRKGREGRKRVRRRNALGGWVYITLYRYEAFEKAYGHVGPQKCDKSRKTKRQKSKTLHLIENPQTNFHNLVVPDDGPEVGVSTIFEGTLPPVNLEGGDIQENR